MKLTAIILLIAGLAAAQNTPVFPARAATNGDLFVATNNFATTLLTGITTATATSATVASAAGLTIPAMVTIDTEIFAVCRIAGNTLTFGKSSCPNADGRGYDGSVAVSHVAGRPVEARVVAGLHNQAAAEVIAVENAVPVMVSDLGPYAALSAANAAAVSAGRTLAISKSWTGLMTQTLGDATFVRGGRVQPSAGQVVTFTGQVNCPVLQQCFDTTVGGPGSILFSPNTTGIPGSVGPVSAEWFGAKCTQNGLSTSTVAAGLANQQAMLSAERALPFAIMTPSGRPMNVGKFTLSQCGVGAYGYPISGTVSISPSVTFSGEGNDNTYMTVPAGAFTPGVYGNYVFDTIVATGDNGTTNDNFNMGLKNVQIFTVPYNASIINGVRWGASLHSTMENVWITTRGMGIYVPGMDGGVWNSIEVNTNNQACGETTLKSQGLVFADNIGDNLVDTINNLKFLFAGANGPPQTDAPLGCTVSGMIYGARPMLEIGHVNGLIINGAAFESVPYPIVVRYGYNVKLNSFATYLDCGTSCPFDVPCAATISSGALGFHMDLSANHATRGICIGEAWAPNSNVQSGNGINLITLIDPYGCVEQTPGNSLTTGATPPNWPGLSCTGTTADGAITWTALGPVNIACSPQLQNATQYLSTNSGYQQNCYIPPTMGILTSGQGSYQQKNPPVMGNSGPTVNGTYYYSYDSDTYWISPTPQFVSVKGVNFNSTADQIVYVSFPAGYNRFLIKSVTLSNASAPLTTARAGVTAGPQASPGCYWIGANNSWESTNQAQAVGPVPVITGVTGSSCIGYGTAASGNPYNSATGYERQAGFFYVEVTVPQGAPATADMTFELQFLP